MDGELQVISVEALATISGVILFAQIIYALFVEPVLKIKFGPQEPKEQRDKRWPVAANLAIVSISLVLAEMGAVGWIMVQPDAIGRSATIMAVVNGALLGIYATGLQVLGYEGVKNFNKLRGG
jgi:hypothetical protein